MRFPRRRRGEPKKSRIRKQVGDLVPGDLERFPIWELATDEEGEEGQVQPTIVTDRGQVGFWSGIHVPTREELDVHYHLLGKSAAGLFPLRYRALVPCGEVDPAEALDGFLHYAPGGTRQIVAET